MIDITALASSSAGNAHLVSDGCSPLLLDCGLSIKRLRETTGHRLTSLTGCLVSHEHLDHLKAAADLMRAGVDCYMSQGTAEAAGIAGHRLKIVRALEQVQIGTWTVLPFDVVHDAAEPLGFLLASGKNKLLYLTDTAYCRYRFVGLTHIMIEANYCKEILDRNVESGALPVAMKARLLRSHMSIDRVLECLRCNDLSRVREVRLIHLSDGNSDAADFKRQVQRATGKPVIVEEK